MSYLIRLAVKKDEPFLWDMLYYAAHMAEDGATSSQSAKDNPDLHQYVQGWGSNGDLGFIAVLKEANRPVGAAWLRLLLGQDKTYAYVDDQTPEMAIATLPEHLGKGLGTQLLGHLLAAARHVYPAVVLSVRADNPAKRLYERLGFVVIGEVINRVGSKSYQMQITF